MCLCKVEMKAIYIDRQIEVCSSSIATASTSDEDMDREGSLVFAVFKSGRQRCLSFLLFPFFSRFSFSFAFLSKKCERRD